VICLALLIFCLVEREVRRPSPRLRNSTTSTSADPPNPPADSSSKPSTSYAWSPAVATTHQRSPDPNPSRPDYSTYSTLIRSGWPDHPHPSAEYGASACGSALGVCGAGRPVGCRSC
jgi:hypothetical protein